MKNIDGLPTIHYTQVPEFPTDSPVYQETQTFRRELPRLLAEGHEGKWAVIKGNDVVGLYGTFDEACDAGWQRYLLQAFIVQPVREWQPMLQMKVHF